MSAIKRTCSSVRNGYREMVSPLVINCYSGAHQLQIRNSVDEDDSKNSTLNDFVYEVATRFHPSNVARVINTSTIQHVAVLVSKNLFNKLYFPHQSLQRRFALENPDLLGVGEAEDDDDEYTPAGPAGGTSSNADAGDGDGVGPTADLYRPGSAASVTTRGRKRKRANRQKGNDFWSMLEKWFSARMTPEQYGPAWNNPGWKT